MPGSFRASGMPPKRKMSAAGQNKAAAAAATKKKEQEEEEQGEEELGEEEQGEEEQGEQQEEEQKEEEQQEEEEQQGEEEQQDEQQENQQQHKLKKSKRQDGGGGEDFELSYHVGGGIQDKTSSLNNSGNERFWINSSKGKKSQSQHFKTACPPKGTVKHFRKMISKKFSDDDLRFTADNINSVEVRVTTEKEIEVAPGGNESRKGFAKQQMTLVNSRVLGEEEIITTSPLFSAQLRRLVSEAVELVLLLSWRLP